MFSLRSSVLIINPIHNKIRQGRSGIGSLSNSPRHQEDTAGHAVDIAGSRGEALKLAETRVYHLVLSDIDLPDGSGTALLKELRQLYPLKSIALTGLAAELDRTAIADAGFDRHFAKPVDWRKIEKAMSELLPQYPRCN